MLTELAVIVEGDTIVNLISLLAALRPSALKDPDFVDLQGLCVSPGFIDIQIDDGGNRLFNDAPTDKGWRIGIVRQIDVSANLLPHTSVSKLSGRCRLLFTGSALAHKS